MELNGSSKPFWLKGLPAGRRRPALLKDASADACVIGAGFAGLYAAYVLAKAGRSVIVVESGDPCSGESIRTTAHMASYQDDGLVELERLHGAEGARTAVSAHAAAIDFVEALVSEEGIDCEFRRLDGWLLAEDAQEARELSDELAACRRAGLEVSREHGSPLPGWTGRAALRFARQATFHPGKLLAGLALAAERRGARLYARSRVAEVQDGPRPTVALERGPLVQARALVLATNTPIVDRVALSSRQAAYRTYALAVRVPRGAVPDGLYWDMKDPYHYVRLARDGRWDALIVGGEDHRTGQTGEYYERLERLEAWTRERFERAGPVVARWSGQVQESSDGVCFIGLYPAARGAIYVATGDSGQGTTSSAIAGMLLADLALGRKNEWEDLFRPTRATLGAASEYAAENVQSALGYLEHLAPDELDSPSQIKPGEGAVMRRGLEKTAVYRRPDGTIFECSAVCPHLGGVVAWNALEKTWDCPAHGSRFSPEGEPLCGPTRRPLTEKEPPERRDRPGDWPAL